MRHHLSLSSVVGLLVVLASCGGSDDAVSPSVSSATDDAAAASSESVTPTPDDAPGVTSESASSDNATEPGTGMIQIGDTRHDLSVAFCGSFADALSARAASMSEPDNVSVNFNFSPEDWRERSSEGWTDAGNVRVDIIDQEQQWESGAKAFEGYNLQGIDPASFEITALERASGGQSISGQATFVDLNALVEVGDSTAVSGSFELNCPAN